MAGDDLDLASGIAAGASDSGPSGPPSRRGPSVRPALIVLAVAVAILLLFGILAVVSGPGTTRPAATGKPRVVPGTGLYAQSAVKALGPIEHPGTPPANVLDALVIPRGATTVGHADNSGATTQYDEQMTFSLAGTTQDALVEFYRRELQSLGWSLISVGPASGAANHVEVLAQIGGNDGWYWEVGAIAAPTSFGAGGTEKTPFTLRLFQEPDAD